MTVSSTESSLEQSLENKEDSVKVSREAWIVLALLTMAMAISFADRYVLAMLIEPIKAELGFSDSQIGFITGIAFSAFYAVFGLLIARVSDKYGVRKVIIGSLAVWSVMTALCGAAQNYFHMLIARFGVGAGEAGVSPAAHATLARLFPPSRRSLPLAVFSAGGPAGIMFALLVSGYLEAWAGWRWTFVIMSVPGLILAAVIMRMQGLIPNSGPSVFHKDSHENISVVLGRLIKTPTFVSVNCLISGLVFFAFGQAQWVPAYFERSFDVSRSELGLTLSLTQGFGMIVGVVIGGLFADWLRSMNRKWRAYFIVSTLFAAAPIAVCVFLAGSVTMASLLIGIATFLVALPTGALWASVQDATTEDHRATGSAFTMMVASLIGLGLGPFLIGVLSDLLYGAYGDASLRYALLYSVSAAAVLMLAPLTNLLLHAHRKA